MASTTEMRPMSIEGDTTASPSTTWRQFDLDLGRCVAEAIVRIFGVTVWRARLQAVSAQLRLPSRDTVWTDNDTAVSASGSMSASLSARPVFASVPLTKRWFLPGSARDAQITVAIAEIPAVTEGGSVDVHAVVSVGEDTWEIPVALRFVVLNAEHAAVAITGAAPRSLSDPLRRVFTRIDAAAQFTRST